MNSRQLSKRWYQDYFLWAVLAIPTIVIVACNIALSFQPDLEIFMILGGVILSLVWLFIMAICAFFMTVKGMAMRALFCILAVICIWPTIYALVNWLPIGDYVHLAVAYPQYKVKIDPSPNVKLEFDWGGGGWSAGASYDKTLVYDPTDKLPYQNELQNVKWGKGLIKYPHNWLVTRHLIGHFYLVEQWFQA